MSSLADKPRTIADLIKRLGGIPTSRIRLIPPPGQATVKDVLRIHDREDRLCELVDGVLVEKPMAFYESLLAMLIGHFITEYLDDNDLGVVGGADGMLRLAFDLVRIPDVSFVSWTRLPNREIPAARVPRLVPDLAIEVISEGNTSKEMARKLQPGQFDMTVPASEETRLDIADLLSNYGYILVPLVFVLCLGIATLVASWCGPPSSLDPTT